ncbi:MAG TPA: hypothetical protein VMB26_07255 [Candidatus Binataceae bacterium]|nr:hypothetical protein [Candidatus Binataceae bacterium]
MKYILGAVSVILLQLSLNASAFAQAGTCGAMTPGQLTSLNGFVPFPSKSLWNTDISNAPIDPNSANFINYIGASLPLHPDFGSGKYDGSYIGIPYQIVNSSQPTMAVKLKAYAGQSDPGPMPIPSNALIEGYPKPGNGDRHVLVLDNSGCWLFELFNSHLTKGVWSADSSAIWDMTIDEQRPYTWTSADAAGLPIFVGLARYDEVAAGAINHALRFTLPVTQQAFTPPASHWASSVTDSNAPPMGMRLRLNAAFDISSFSPDNQVILTALKQYGMIVADNGGSAMFITGAPDSRWNNSDLHNLTSLTASDFDVVEMNSIYTESNVPTGPSPAIGSFAANPASISSGQSVTLSWSTSGSIYNIISPAVGPVRGDSVTVAPTSTTIYTLYSTNQYGRSTAKVTVDVQ